MVTLRLSLYGSLELDDAGLRTARSSSDCNLTIDACFDCFLSSEWARSRKLVKKSD